MRSINYHLKIIEFKRTNAQCDWTTTHVDVKVLDAKEVKLFLRQNYPHFWKSRNHKYINEEGHEIPNGIIYRHSRKFKTHIIFSRVTVEYISKAVLLGETKWKANGSLTHMVENTLADVEELQANGLPQR